MLEVDGLNSLVASLEGASLRVQLRSESVVNRGGQRVAKTARDLISGVRHAPLYPASITSEASIVPGGFEAVIGPDKGKPQGALGNLFEYGSVKNAPLAHLGPALDREGPSIEQDLLGLALPS